MPELPEVETTRRGIEPLITGKTVTAVAVRERRLRWPVSPQLERLVGVPIVAVRRRAKYLLLDSERGSAIIHLGMSGSLRVVAVSVTPQRHDHVDIAFEDGTCLRLRDPRRFGAVLWSRDPLQHKLLKSLGPEPFDPLFDGVYLHARARGRKLAVKSLLMDSRVVVGVGNIYASEALHAAGIHPRRPAGRISRPRYQRLSAAVREILAQAIGFGGTTLRDFSNAEGKPGYFRHELSVYDRAGQPCRNCGNAIHQETIGQRSTYYCRRCQR
jgi:formamidopyrimidine-DNA glycosylase